MKNNGIMLLLLAFVAFLFLKNSSATTTNATITSTNNPTSNSIASIVGGLISIFGKSNSPYAGSEVQSYSPTNSY
jgi:hypothetical protein